MHEVEFELKNCVSPEAITDHHSAVVSHCQLPFQNGFLIVVGGGQLHGTNQECL